VFEADGQYLYQIGNEENKFGSKGALKFPRHIRFDSKGELYIADSQIFKIFVLSVEGEILKIFEGGALDYQKGVALGASDEIVTSEFEKLMPGRNEVKNVFGGLRMYSPLE
jgi:hypothetical protein